MVDIKYNDGTPVEDPNNPGEDLSYHIDKGMKRYLDGIKVLINKKDKDWVVLIDGYEGAGKSTLGQQIGRYVDPTLHLDRVCMTADEFKQSIIDAKKGQCVIYDEAVTGLTGGDSVSRVGKLLKSMMMQMRQKNLFVIVILPTVFELNTYAAMSRAKCLFHCYESGQRQGYWIGFNRAAVRLLYLKGKKTRSYKVRTYFRGRFYGKYATDEALYRKKKEEALFLLDDDKKKLTVTEQKHYFGLKVSIIEKVESGMSQQDIAKWYNSKGYPISASFISKMYNNYLKETGKTDFVPLPTTM